MTDHTTLQPVHRSALRSALRGAAATATALVPLGLGIVAAEPAAADSPTVVGVYPLAGGCGLAGIAGTAYDEVRMDLETAFHGTIHLGTSTTGEVQAYYGQDYLHAFGDTGRVVVGGYVDGSLVLDVDMAIPSCETGASLSLDLQVLGTAPGDGAHEVALRGCGDGDGVLGQVVLSPSAYRWSVQVPPGQELCPAVTSAQPGIRGSWVDATPVAVPDGGEGEVEVWVDYASRPVAFANGFVLDGLDVDGSETGLDVGALGWSWANVAGGSTVGAGDCDHSSPQLDCGSSQPRIAPGATVEVAFDGPDGWALERTSFTEADCGPAPSSVGTAAVADPTCWLDLRTLGTTPAEPEVPETTETTETPEVPEQAQVTTTVPAPPEVAAVAQAPAPEAPRTALPRTGASPVLALVGAGLVAVGRAALRARRRLGGS